MQSHAKKYAIISRHVDYMQFCILYAEIRKKYADVYIKCAYICKINMQMYVKTWTQYAQICRNMQNKYAETFNEYALYAVSGENV